MERDRPKAGKNGGAKNSGNGPAEIQMELADILDGIACVRVSGPTDPSVRSIAYDSRKVETDAMFFALPGEKVDGNEFVSGAIAHGAKVIASSSARPADTSTEITWIEIPAGKERRALAQAKVDVRLRRGATMIVPTDTGFRVEVNGAPTIEAFDKMIEPILGSGAGPAPADQAAAWFARETGAVPPKGGTDS